MGESQIAPPSEGSATLRQSLVYQSRPVETKQLKEDAGTLTAFLRLPKVKLVMPDSMIIPIESLTD